MGAPLVLVAASGLAREVLALLRSHPLHEVLGFVDDDPSLAGATVDGLPVLGDVASLAARPDVQVLVCAGRGSARERLVGRLAAAGVGAQRYATVVHPTVEVPVGCTVGSGSVLLAGTVLTAGVSVGRHVVVMPNATLTHDDVLEDFATICAGVQLAGRVRVSRGAYLGTASSVREDVHVGAGATLGMGAALVTDLPAGETWAGVPARPLRSAPAADHTAVGSGASGAGAVAPSTTVAGATVPATATEPTGTPVAPHQEKAGAA